LEEDDFALKEDVIDELLEIKPDLFMLTNPNNPNGRLIEKDLLEKIIEACEKSGTILVLDECFLPLTGREGELSAGYEIPHKSVIVLRAFTKTFAIPGVRIGYAICSKKSMADALKNHLPEWNLSIFAQMAGAQCLKLLNYVEESVKLIEVERGYLSKELSELGFKVFTSDANFILFKSEIVDLKEKLIEDGILIRDCSDYHGLGEGFYRIAIRSHEDNSELISALENIVKK
jgi:histidinol-phosphate/aromatic aminotransferase/cobyric acid decarboxylase-like protein